MNELSRHFVGCRAIGGYGPSRHALLTLLLAAAVVSGCDGESPRAVTVNQPVVTTPPPAAPALNTDTALSLYESAWVHASLTASALEYATTYYEVWTTDACVFGSGSMWLLWMGAQCLLDPCRPTATRSR